MIPVAFRTVTVAPGRLPHAGSWMASRTMAPLLHPFVP